MTEKEVGMEVNEAVNKRRARRALSPIPLRPDEKMRLLQCMRLSPSCFNNQPWRVVVVDDPQGLASLRACLSKGNAWAAPAPLIMAVCSREEDDCQLSDRRAYHHFGCGLAVGEMLLEATGMGLIAHPIAGYDPRKAKQALGIPDEMTLITLVIIGRPGDDLSLLSEKQRADEFVRPMRKPLGENFFHGRWGSPWDRID
jgi:nitroreductase